MNLTLADIKAIADRRFKSPFPWWATTLWLLVVFLLLVPLVIMAFQGDQPNTYTLPDGKELKVDGDQVTIGNTILEQTTPGQNDQTVFIVIAVIASLWYLAIIPILIYEGGEKAKYRKAYLEVWSRTKEIPEEVE